MTLKHLLSFLTVFFSFTLTNHSQGIKGMVYDAENGEWLVGATIYIEELQKGTMSGLDGSYAIKSLPLGTYTIKCSSIGYNPVSLKISIESGMAIQQDFSLKPATTILDEITVTANAIHNTDFSVRNLEKNAIQAVNMVSAKAIEISPDLTMANVLQRMSGIAIDKESSRMGQYVLLRGMDKRYNYTLVNGIKIPSTHNKHRYVSMDMFPSDLIDRVEVTKSITPDMEGDGIGGSVNLAMKNAPESFYLQVNGSTGIGLFHLTNEFITFNTSNLNPLSPYERNGQGYRAVASDFPSENLKIIPVDLPINYTGNLTIGNRFLNQKLGWIVSGSFQNYYNGEKNLYFKDDLSRDGKNLPVLTDMQERIYNEHKQNQDFHSKIDYRFGTRHKMQLYTLYFNQTNTQIRDVQKTDLAVSYDPENGNLNRSHSIRFRYNIQRLFNFTFQDFYTINPTLKINVSMVYSIATNRTPDEATIIYGNSLENFKPVRQYVDFDGSDRVWRRNSDEDLAGYLNLVYTPYVFGIKTELLGGALIRNKKRTSFYNKYTLQAITRVATADTSYYSFYSEKGIDWNTYDEINWQVYNPRGTIAVGENYNAFEKMTSGYVMFRISEEKVQLAGGIRYELTDQGYAMKFPIGEPNPSGNQKYGVWLPGIHLKYSPFKLHNFRASYYRAVNKPGFHEIVPYIDASEEPTTAGNKNLLHATADNVDLRWEYFPSSSDQIMTGLFYKNIKNPIEFAFDKYMNISQKIVYTPINSDKAINYGFEFDVIKYYRQFGIKANYTLTRSQITTRKLSRVKDQNGNDSTAYVFQTRPLFGQSAHVGNISFLYKGANNGINAQLALAYTGDRIYTVSRYIDNDLWQKGYWQLDLSAEKNFKNGICLFIKGHNLLNSHVRVYIKKTNPLNYDVPYHSAEDINTMVRDEYSLQTVWIGFRYRFH